MNTPTISVIIVTYNTGEIVLDALASVLAQSLPVELILVDNQSSDDTVELVRDQFPDVQVIVSQTNSGFGGGNNLGFQHASGDYLVLVNPDLRLGADALNTMLVYLQENPTVSIVGPRTVNADGHIALTARSVYSVFRIILTYFGLTTLLPHLLRREERAVNLHATEPQTVVWLQGSCMVMKREIFDALGGFDEGFFLYAEDVDLCYRARALGKQVIYHPQARATHLEGTTTGNFPYFRVRSYHLSPLYFFRKRGKHAQVIVLKLFFTVELLLKSTLRRLRNLVNYSERRANHARAELKVLWETWRY